MADELFGANTLSRFWRLEPDVPPAAWEAAAAAAGLLPAGPEVLKQRGWDGLIGHILGEAHLGPDRDALPRSKRLYYTVRPVIPRRLLVAARRPYLARRARSFPLGWPIEDRYVRFLYAALEHVIGRSAAPGQPERAERRWRGFWPGDAQFAFVITHDVETAAGQSLVRTLADLDWQYGFRSSFNFVPEGYRVDETLLADLRQGGFEVGLHGLRHDAKLFWSKADFDRRASAINRYLREWGAVGFRSPFMHRHAEWLQALEIDYDASFFDTDPYEPVPGGTMSIWPFFCGRFVELPYTLPQDHTLLVVLRQRTPRLWLEKVEFIARWGGMALVIVHPDYMRDPSHRRVYEEFLRQMAERRTSCAVKAEAGRPLDRPAYWHALPRDVVRWWRTRAGLSQG